MGNRPGLFLSGTFLTTASIITYRRFCAEGLIGRTVPKRYGSGNVRAGLKVGKDRRRLGRPAQHLHGLFARRLLIENQGVRKQAEANARGFGRNGLNAGRALTFGIASATSRQATMGNGWIGQSSSATSAPVGPRPSPGFREDIENSAVVHPHQRLRHRCSPFGIGPRFAHGQLRFAHQRLMKQPFYVCLVGQAF